jgi:hypothetical protein
MDDARFDRFVLALSRAGSRRWLVGGSVSLLLGLFGEAPPVAAGQKHKKKHKKHKKSKDHCEDGEQNHGETDTDCGGPCAQKCVFGQNCAVNADCTTGRCETAAEVPLGKVCTECRIDSDCDRLGDPRKFRCFGHACFECAANFDCPRPGQTASNTFCVEPVTGECPRNTACVCRECRTSDDCPAEQFCNETNTCQARCSSARGTGVNGGCPCIPDGEPCTQGTNFCCSPSSTCVLRNGQNICFD